jgi:hypothetical protein
MKTVIVYTAYESCRDFEIFVATLTDAQLAELGTPNDEGEWHVSEDMISFNPSEDLQPIPFPVQVEGTLYFWAD